MATRILPTPDELEQALLAHILSPPVIRIAVIAATLMITNQEFHKIWMSRHTTKPHDWYMEKRMEAAAKLLLEGNTIDETARILGYASVGGLLVPFRTRFGKSPTEYIAEHREAESLIKHRAKVVEMSKVVAINARRIRCEKNWTQAKVAKALGVVASKYTLRESGEMLFSREQIERLAKALEVTSADLLEGFEINQNNNLQIDSMAEMSLGVAIGKNLRRIRKEKQLTLKDLEDLTDIEAYKLDYMEGGGHKFNRVMIEKLAMALGVPPSDLTEGADPSRDIAQLYETYKGLSVADIRLVEDSDQEADFDPEQLAKDTRKMLASEEKRSVRQVIRPVPKETEEPDLGAEEETPAQAKEEPVAPPAETASQPTDPGSAAQLLIEYTKQTPHLQDMVEKLYKARLTDKITDLALYVQRKLLPTVIVAYVSDEDNKVKAVERVRTMSEAEKFTYLQFCAQGYDTWKAALFPEEELSLGVLIAANTEAALVAAFELDKRRALADLLLPLIRSSSSPRGVDMGLLSMAVGEWIEDLTKVQQAITEYLETTK